LAIHLIPIEPTIRNASKGGKPLVSEIHDKQSIEKENLSLFMNSIL